MTRSETSDEIWDLKSMLRLRSYRWIGYTEAILLVLLGTGCSSHPTPLTVLSSDAGPPTRRVSFVQWTDPHVFDAGKGRHAEGVQEEALDDWAAFHWAVMETNRLVLAEHRSIDFVVITGDFGLENVQLPPVKEGHVNAGDCPHRRPGEEGPIETVPLDEAAAAVARELSALVVKKVYLVPGNNDLCNEDPNDEYRWAEFVLVLQETIKKQDVARKASLKESWKNAASVEPPPMPVVVDLTYMLSRLYYTRQDPRIVALFADGSRPKPDLVPSIPPVVNGIYLLGLDSSFFKRHDDPKLQTAADNASSAEMEFISRRITPGASYLIFTHIPDLRDPYAGSGAQETSANVPQPSSMGAKLRAATELATQATNQSLKNNLTSSWKLPDQARQRWQDKILNRSEVLGIYAGHFHTGSRDLYPHNFGYAQPDKNTAAKFWLAPPLAEKYQWGLPPEQTARGMLLVSVNANGDTRVLAAEANNIKPSALWFSTLDQTAATIGDDKLAQAHAAELDGQWDDAASKYHDTLGVTGTDARTRATALSGYLRTREEMRSWWWRSPLSRWLYLYSKPLLYSVALILAVVLGWSLLRLILALKLASVVLRFLIVPRFRGRAVISDTAQLTTDAPVKEFSARLQAEGEEIKARLLQEKENWAAGHVTFLAPSSSSLDSLVGSIPKVESLDVSALVKFLVNLLQTFRWTVQTGLAVFPPNQIDPSAPPAAGSDKSALLPGSELSAYAVLQWGGIVKNGWRRGLAVGTDRSAMTDLARELAELILGEAFV